MKPIRDRFNVGELFRQITIDGNRGQVIYDGTPTDIAILVYVDRPGEFNERIDNIVEEYLFTSLGPENQDNVILIDGTGRDRTMKLQKIDVIAYSLTVIGGSKNITAAQMQRELQNMLIDSGLDRAKVAIFIKD